MRAKSNKLLSRHFDILPQRYRVIIILKGIIMIKFGKASFGSFRWSVCIFGLMAGFLVTEVAAQDLRATDAALGALIEKLADRSTDGLVSETRPDGSESVDLQGRFQQVVLAQLIDGDQAITSCVNSVAEADVFFGRNLSTGAPL